MQDGTLLVTDKDNSGSPRTARSAARRQHLLDTARNLFVDRGFHQTGMAQIAAASGIAVGQIYRDFENKEAIVNAICQVEMAAWLEEDTLDAAIAGADHAALVQWIEHICLGGPKSGDRRLMSELLAEVSRNPAIAESNELAQQRVRTVMGNALRCLAPDAAEERLATAIDFLMAIIWGVVALYEVAPRRDHCALRTRMAAAIRYELQAVGAP